MLRIVFHSLYKIYYIMYYITWHKIFHRFANKVLPRRGMVLVHKAVKYCCPLCLAIVFLFSNSLFESLVVYAAESSSTSIFASSGVWVAIPVSITSGNGLIEADMSFNAVPLGQAYSWWLTRSRGRTPIGNSISFGAYIQPDGTSTYPKMYISYNGKIYYDSGTNTLSPGLFSGVVYPSSRPNQSYQFDIPNPPRSATPITLSYPSGGYDNFGEDSFKHINFFANNTNQVFRFSRYYRNFVDDDGFTLPMDARDIRLYVKIVVNMRGDVLADTTDIFDSVVSGFSDILDILQSGFTSIDDSIAHQNSVIQNSVSQQTTILNNRFWELNGNINNRFWEQTTSLNKNNDQNTQKILDQNSQFRQEDREEAQSIGKVAQEFLDTNTQQVKSNFNILWEPIAFTQRVVSVFTGGTRSSTYASRYDGVVGFIYNERTGCLDPVIDISPRARYGRASNGTSITFPAYTLPVLNLKLWDSYTFDVSTIKSAFPALFNAIYIFSGVLCLYWFLGFLSQKFEEVFKE